MLTFENLCPGMADTNTSLAESFCFNFFFGAQAVGGQWRLGLVKKEIPMRYHLVEWEIPMRYQMRYHLVEEEIRITSQARD
jgi:hypothetical protein